jgi:hypothetical protein
LKRGKILRNEELPGRISVSFDEKLEAHVFRFSGQAPVSEMLQELFAVYRNHDVSRPLNLLFVDAGLTRHLTRGEIVNVMDFARRNRPLCSGRTALVGPSDLSFGTFRMAEGMGGEFSRHVRVFRSIEEAVRWITLGEASAGVA